MFTSNIRLGKSDFNRGLVAGARRAGLCIFATADLLGVLQTLDSRVYTEGCKKLTKKQQQQQNIDRATVLWVKRPC